MRTYRPAARDGGFALLLVLWAMVLLAILAAQVTGAGRAESHLAAAMRISAQLQEAADGAVYETIWHLLDGSGEAWPVGAGSYELAEPGARVHVDIEDERGKLDINQVPVQLLQALFGVLGFDNATAMQAAQGIEDWHQQGGPNDSDSGVPAEYRMEGRPWGPPGQEFERLDELKLVRGMTPDLYRAARPYLTLALEQGPWLPYASPPVLAAIARAKRLANLTVDQPDARGPVVLRLTATATGPEGARFIRRVLLRMDGSLSGPAWKYRFLSWDSGPDPDAPPPAPRGS